MTTLTGHEDWIVDGLFVADDSRLVVTTGWDGNVIVWDSRMSQPAARLQQKGSVVRCLAEGPESLTILGGDVDGAVSLFDVRAGRVCHRHTCHTQAVNAVAAYQQRVVSAGSDNYVRIWDVQETFVEQRSFDHHSDWVTDFSVTHDGTVVSSSGNGDVFLWSFSDCSVLAQVKCPSSILACAAIGDDEAVISAVGGSK